METIPMTDTSVTSHERGKAGRPPSPATRKAKLRAEYRNAIGVNNLTSTISEAIASAVDLTIMASDVRTRIAKNGGGNSEDLLALVRIENAVGRAIARLPVPAPTAINTVAVAV
jgi:hypothetical protein